MECHCHKTRKEDRQSSVKGILSVCPLWRCLLPLPCRHHPIPRPTPPLSSHPKISTKMVVPQSKEGSRSSRDISVRDVCRRGGGVCVLVLDGAATINRNHFCCQPLRGTEAPRTAAGAHTQRRHPYYSQHLQDPFTFLLVHAADKQTLVERRGAMGPNLMLQLPVVLSCSILKLSKDIPKFPRREFPNSFSLPKASAFISSSFSSCFLWSLALEEKRRES